MRQVAFYADVVGEERMTSLRTSAWEAMRQATYWNFSQELKQRRPVGKFFNSTEKDYLLSCIH